MLLLNVPAVAVFLLASISFSKAVGAGCLLAALPSLPSEFSGLNVFSF